MWLNNVPIRQLIDLCSPATVAEERERRFDGTWPISAHNDLIESLSYDEFRLDSETLSLRTSLFSSGVRGVGDG